jgi:hypothetical protein
MYYLCFDIGGVVVGDSFSPGAFPCAMAIRVGFPFSCVFGTIVPPWVITVVIIGPPSMVARLLSHRLLLMVLPLGREGCLAGKDHLGYIKDIFVVKSMPFGLLWVLPE